MATPRGAWGIACLGLLVLAVALLWLAFTGFSEGTVPQPGSPGFAPYQEQRVREAQLSLLVGLAGCFALLGSFACFAKARQAAPPAPAPSDPQP